jgi:hypothetical protein
MISLHPEYVAEAFDIYEGKLAISTSSSLWRDKTIGLKETNF